MTHPRRKTNNMAGRKTLICFFLLAILASFQAKAYAQAPQSSRRAQAKTSPIKTVATRLRGFGIPFKINSDDDSFIEVQLYVSSDQGQSWQFLTRQTTDQTEIPFQAKQDGEYWFSLKTLNRDRRLIPEGDPQPELKIIVDTVQPQLDFRIATDAAGRVICRWKAEDEHLDPTTLRIRYQPILAAGTINGWNDVPVEFNSSALDGVYSDQIAWWPETNEQALNVVIEVSDTAGNQIQIERQIVVPQIAWRHKPQSTAQITDRSAPRNDAASNWAQPDAGSTPDSQPSSLAGQTPQPLKKPPTQGAAHELPPNVVCEDGICRVIPPAVANQVPTQIKQTAKRPTQLVGSRIEYAAPPVPAGYVPTPTPPSNQRPVSLKPGPQTDHASASGSIEWQSESEKWVSPSQTSRSTTLQIDPSLAPQSPSPLQPRTILKVPSNPSVASTDGNRTIGQSTTQRPNNLYHSPNSQGSQGIAPTTLLPGIPEPNPARTPTDHASLPSDRSQFRNAGHAGTQSEDLQSVMKTPMTGRRTNAPTQIIGSKRFQLNYGIDSIDPSGVARVELWVTRNQGQTWSAWGVDPDNRSPFPVVVEEEGHFGFRIVVHSRDGLTGQGPSSGDDADMWIQVDMQAPLTRITSVPYGRGDEAGRLVILYSVTDPFLTLRPITLAYSPDPTGPWTLIEEGVRNEGRFVWKVRTNIPDQIFLRIEAIDKAGNLGVHVLKQPIDVSGLVPRGTIHGVIPVGSRSPGN